MSISLSVFGQLDFLYASYLSISLRILKKAKRFFLLLCKVEENVVAHWRKNYQNCPHEIVNHTTGNATNRKLIDNSMHLVSFVESFHYEKKKYFLFLSLWECLGGVFEQRPHISSKPAYVRWSTAVPIPQVVFTQSFSSTAFLLLCVLVFWKSYTFFVIIALSALDDVSGHCCSTSFKSGRRMWSIVARFVIAHFILSSSLL